MTREARGHKYIEYTITGVYNWLLDLLGLEPEHTNE
jgi:hypothetical protein